MARPPGCALGPLALRIRAPVVGRPPIEERLEIRGDTCLSVGNRGEAETFPYGYFKMWLLDTNTGRFAPA